MNKTKFVVVVTCLVLMVCGGCRGTPAEQAIREVIAAMQNAGEAHDVGGVIAPVADDFIGAGDDEAGPLDRKGLQRYLTFMQMREGGAIHPHIGPIKVELHGNDRATATFTAIFTGGAGLLPDDGQIEHIRTGWRRDGGNWKLISAEWKRATTAD